MKIKEIKKKSDKELQKMLAKTRNELREVRFKVASKQFKNYKKICQIKKDISRMLAVLREKQLLNNSFVKESK